MPPVKDAIKIMREFRRNSKKGYLARFVRLTNERSTWIQHWQDIADNILPRRIRVAFDTGKRNSGQKLNQKIINGHAKQCLKILSSGMMSGISSPARPWFRLRIANDELMKTDNVRQWLHDIENVMRHVFSGSNFYNILQLTYRDIAAFGIAAMCIEEDDTDVIRAYSFPIGSYAVQNNHRLEVDTVYHEKFMTVGQIASAWGLDNASAKLKTMWERNEHDTPVRILHVIEPNEEMIPGALGRAGMKYRSVWIEYDGGPMDGPPLYEDNGFHEFPAMVPRWDLNGEDSYGDCPGMDALGDIRALQQLERRKLQAVDKIITPPMVGPTALANKHKSQLAGDMTYNDTTSGSQKFEPAYQIDPKIVYMDGLIDKHENRISKAFYNDLFMMLASMDQAQPITAREVDEKHEEKMLQLGPVLERLHDELLTRAIDRTFEILVRRSEGAWRVGQPGIIPAPPPELQGVDLKVEFISILAQAQKLLGTIAVERLMAFVGSNVAVFPEAADKIDIDAVIDDYAEMLGTNPKLVREGEELAAVREQRAQQQKMAAMGAMAKPVADAAGAAKNMAEADQGQPGQLDALMGALQAA